MAHGIPQLESRNWNFKNDVKVTGDFQKSPGRYVLEEYFKQLPSINASIAISTNVDFEILGTNASADDVTFATTVGGLDLETDTGDNDQVIVLPHLDTSQTAWTGIKWGTENQVIWECSLRTGPSIASVGIWAGLKLTNVLTTATDDNQVFFKFDTDASDTTWRLISSIAGTDTNTDSALTVAVDTTYRFKISVDSDRKATFFIDDVAYFKTAALTNDIDLIPYVGVQTMTTAAKKIFLNYERISRIIFE